MTRKLGTSPILLRWSDHIPAADVQDPLGLGLRGSARLASRLLYCITSITPRARYFSFIPWCILDYQQRELGEPHALGLRESIILREQAFTLACVAHHKGESCAGGGLVGSRDARRWLAKGHNGVNFKTLKRFAKNPALSAYVNSVVNLGLFAADVNLPDSDEGSDDEEFAFDDIELSALGQDLARRYEATAGSRVTKQFSSKDRSCTIAALAEFGKRGGLCELSLKGSNDRELLRDMFFALVGTRGDSHPVRRQSLLLILELCRQLGAEGLELNEVSFGKAVYFGEVTTDKGGFEVVIPKELIDIATRWRMFYFHHFMGVALEGMFSWLVSQLANCGLAGATLESLVAQLDEPRIRKDLSKIFQFPVRVSFGDLAPSALLREVGLREGNLDTDLSRSIDRAVRPGTRFAEDSLEELLRSNEHRTSSTGLALPMVLMAVTLGRYSQWDASNYGQWLASAASDQYLDLVPPLTRMGLSRRFGDWWKCSWRELTSFVLSRYVVRQHQSMSYEKTRTGERCLLQVDGPKFFSTGGYDKIGMGNPRLGSAIQILTDLGLMEQGEKGIRELTLVGKEFLKRTLEKEAGDQVR